MNKLRKTARAEDAGQLIDGLRDIDFALVRLVDRGACMTLAGAGDLVAMQRRFRKLRYEIEIETARINAGSV